MYSSPKAFVAFATVSLLALVFLPTYQILSMDLFSQFALQRDWELGGIFFDQSDVFMAAILMALVFKVSGSRRLFWQIPKMRLWIALGLLLSVAYVLGPENQKRLTDPIRIAYQIYRYCWKEILYLPLAALLITDERRVRVALFALLLGADLCAIQAIIEGYQGYRTGGFLGANTVGSAYALPVTFALGLLIRPRTKWQSAFCWVSLVLLARAVLFSQSRGSLIGLFCSVVFFMALASTDVSARRRITRVSFVLVFAMLTLLAVRPDITERPNIERALTATSPLEQGTLRWRMTERWPYFLDIIKAHPWFGTGVTAVAEELSRTANTPHQGYIAFAARSGIPALAVALFLIISGCLAGIRFYFDSEKAKTFDGVVALSCSSAIVGILVHNLAESTLSVDVVRVQIWFCVGLLLSWSRLSEPEQIEA